VQQWEIVQRSYTQIRVCHKMADQGPSSQNPVLPEGEDQPRRQRWRVRNQDGGLTWATHKDNNVMCNHEKLYKDNTSNVSHKMADKGASPQNPVLPEGEDQPRRQQWQVKNQDGDLTWAGTHFLPRTTTTPALTPCWIFSSGRLRDYFKKVWNYEKYIKWKFLLALQRKNRSFF